MGEEREGLQRTTQSLWKAASRLYGVNRLPATRDQPQLYLFYFAPPVVCRFLFGSQPCVKSDQSNAWLHSLQSLPTFNYRKAILAFDDSHNVSRYAAPNENCYSLQALSYRKQKSTLRQVITNWTVCQLNNSQHVTSRIPKAVCRQRDLRLQKNTALDKSLEVNFSCGGS